LLTIGFVLVAGKTSAQVVPGSSCADAVEISVTETQTNIDPNDPIAGATSNDCAQFTESFNGGCSSSYLGSYGVIYEYSLGDEFLDPFLGNCISFLGASIGQQPFGMFLMDGCPSDPGTSCIAQSQFDGNVDYGLLGPMELPTPNTYYLVISVPDNNCAGGNCPGFKVQVVRSNQTDGEFGCNPITTGSTCNNAAGVTPGVANNFNMRNSRDDFSPNTTCWGYDDGEDYVLNYSNGVTDICVDFDITLKSTFPEPISFYISEGCPGGVGSYCVEKYSFSGSQDQTLSVENITLRKNVDYYFVVEELNGNGDDNVIDFTMFNAGVCEPGQACSGPVALAIGSTVSRSIGQGSMDDNSWNRYYSGNGQPENLLTGDNVVFELSPSQDECVEITLDEIADQIAGKKNIAEIALFDGCIEGGTTNNLISSGRCAEINCSDVSLRATLRGGRNYYVIVTINSGKIDVPDPHFTGTYRLSVQRIDGVDPELFCSGCSSPALDDCKTCMNGNLEAFSSDGWRFYVQDDPAAPFQQNFQVLNLGVNHFDTHFSLAGGSQKIPSSNFSAVKEGEYSLVVGGFDYPSDANSNCSAAERCQLVQRDVLVDTINSQIEIDLALMIEGNTDGDNETDGFAQLWLSDGSGALVNCNALHFSPRVLAPAGFTNEPFTSISGSANILNYKKVVYPVWDYLGQVVTLNLKVCDSEFKENQSQGFIEFNCTEVPYLENPDTACFGEVMNLRAPSVAGITGYTWDDGTTNVNRAVTSTGDYFVTIDYLGCQYTIDYPVYFFEDVVFDISFAPLCVGEVIAVGNNTILPQNTVVDVYSWNLDESQDPTIESNATAPTLIRNQPGTYDINLQMTTAFGCVHDTVLAFTIEDPFEIQFDAIGPYCPLDDAFRMEDTLNPIPAGGFILESGVTKVNFDPGLVTPGTVRNFTYLTTDPTTGCSIEKDFEIGVLDTLPIYFSQIPEVCFNGEDLLLAFGNPSPGIYSGSGVALDGGSGDYFLDPTIPPFSPVTVSYEITGPGGCKNIKEAEITILPEPNVQFFTDPPDICANDNAFVLDQGRPVDNPPGQFYSGSGVRPDAALFDPNLSGSGDHTVVYHYTNPTTGCSSTDTTIIVVSDTADFILDAAGADVCRNENPFYGDFVSPSGGTYSGPAINGAGMFDPALIPANQNQTTVYYLYKDPISFCTAETEIVITIFDAPVVTMPSFPDVCENGNNVSLGGAGPSGGVYSGPGVSSGIFNPRATGAGNFQIVYSATSSKGCIGTGVANIKVLSKPIGVVFNDIPPLCDQEAPYQLTEGNPSGGIYIGDGVNSGFFDASGASSNPQEILYVYTDPGNGCSDSLSQFIEIFNESLIFAGNDTTVCTNSNAFNPGGGKEFPSGGVFSGPFVASGLFDPAAAGPGVYKLFYTYNSTQGCAGLDSMEVLVRTPVGVGHSDLPNICENGDPVDLSGGAPQGGYYSGFGVVSQTKFDPDLTGSGTFTLVYTVVDGSDCLNEVDVDQTVNAVPTVLLDQSLITFVCKGNGPVNLSSFGAHSPPGGAFIGDQVLNGILNLDTYTTDSIIPISYAISNAGSGCSDTAVVNLEIRIPEPVNMLSPDSVCLNTTPFLIASNYSSGTFTGSAVVNGEFDPQLGNPGVDNQVDFVGTNKGCTVNARFDVFIFDDPNLSQNPIGPICKFEGPVRLENGSPAGGYYSGTFVSNDQFYPGQAGVGIHSIFYNFEDSHACSYTLEFTIEVEEGNVTLNFPTEICTNEPPFTLSGGSPTGGNYFVDNTELTELDASAYTVGPHKIKYESVGVTTNCVGEIELSFEIVAPPQIAWSSFGVICDNEASFNLTQAFPVGGSYQVNGNATAVFIPTSLGQGTHTVSYTVSNSAGCVSTSSVNVIINESPIAIAPSPEFYCFNQEKIILPEGTPVGGRFDGPGMDAGGVYFEPSSLSPGFYDLNYILENFIGCSDSAIFTVEIRPTPNVSLDPIPELCDGASPIVLNYGKGPFSGTSTDRYEVGNSEQTSFDPGSYGVGSHNVLYEFKDGNCIDSAFASIIVNPKPNVVIATFPNEICENADPFPLVGSTPNDAGGQYFINNTPAGSFNPATLGLGTHEIRFDYSDAKGCSESDSHSIEVLAAPVVQVIPQPELCVNGGTFVLNQGTPSGTFTGPGMLGDGLTFDPAATAGVGTYNLTFVESASNACIQNSPVQVDVVDQPNVNVAQISDQCANGASFDLLPFATPVNGSYFYQGNPIAGNSFNPAIFGSGDHEVEYRFTSNQGCSGSAFQTIKVLSPPVASLAGFPVICENDPFHTFVEGLPTNGTYRYNNQSVSGIDPSLLGDGVFALEYRFTDAQGCSDTVATTFEIFAKPALTVGDQPDACVQGSVVDLVPGTPTNGAFSGLGVVNVNQFDPAAAGLGNKALTYTISGANGCQNSAISNIQVIDGDAIQLDQGLTFCSGDPQVDLMQFVEPKGGAFVLLGDTLQNDSLTPSAYSAGVYTLEYRFISSNGCYVSGSTNFEIFDKPVVSLNPLPVFCSKDPDYVLTEGAPVGGVYKLNGAAINSISPTALDSGDFVLEYELTSSGGCKNSAFQNFRIHHYPDLSFPTPIPACVNSGGFTWGGALPAGGNYKGPGTSGNQFDPAAAGIGFHEIWYVFANLVGCMDSIAATMEVFDNADVDLAPFQDVCENENAFQLNQGSPVGGVYSGPGVFNGVFDPSLAGDGVHTIRYDWTSGADCEGFATNTVRVLEVEPLVVYQETEVCENGAPFVLDAVSPTNGEYSGANVFNGEFNPGGLAPGDYTIDYKFISVLGCKDSAEVPVRVKEKPIVNQIDTLSFCSSVDTLYLFGGSPIGGKYIGTGVQNESFVEPPLLGAGFWDFKYTYNNSFGCSDTADGVLEIYEKPVVTFNQSATVCLQGDSILLDKGLPQGGMYKGPGVANSYFYPSLAGTGTHTLQYLYTDALGCRDSAATQFSVNSEGLVGINPIPFHCINSGTRILSEGYPAGGIYSGTGVVNGSFDPIVAGVGNHTIFYEHETAQGCKSKVSTDVLVRNIPVVVQSAFANTCSLTDSLILVGGSPLGGVYSGPGVFNDSVFYPVQVSSGSYQLRYTYTDGFGCTNKDSAIINVLENPTASLAPLNGVCLDADSVLLTTGTPSGGYYSGPGVVNSYLYPSQAGEGIFTYFYTISDPDGCDGSASANFEVFEQPNVSYSGPAFVCQGDDPIVLSGGLPEGGIYSGVNVSNGVFNQSGLNPGTYRMVYTFAGIGGCKDSAEHFIQVKGLPVVTLSSPNPVCSDAPIFDLYGGSPLGGTYSGPGVTNNQVSPSVLGEGTHPLYYTFTESSGCSNTDTAYLVINPLPAVYFDGVGQYCENDAPVELLLGQPSGGSYTGVGVVNDFYHPDIAGPGSFDLDYTYTDNNGCTSSARTRVTVLEVPEVNFVLPDFVCSKDDPLYLDFATPDGGIYSGPGVIQGNFYPDQITPGILKFLYTFTDDFGCTNMVEDDMWVRENPEVQSEDTLIFCANDQPYLLVEGAPTGGVWNGEGIAANKFDAGSVGDGTYEAEYTVLNQFGCAGSDTSIMVVNPLPIINFTGDLVACAGDSVLALTGGFPAGGSYFGPFVSNNNFNVYSVNPGDFTIYYTIQNGFGCRDTAQSNVEVLTNPVVPQINSNSPVCAGETVDVSLNPMVGQSYSWSGPNGFASNQNSFQIPNAQPVHNGQYLLIVFDGTCYSDSTFIPIAAVVPPVDINYTLNTPLCELDTLFASFDSVPGVNTIWKLGGNSFAGSEQKISPLEIDWNGDTYLILDGGSCFKDTLPLDITIFKSPISPTLNSIPVACFGNEYLISVEAHVGHTTVWETNTGSFTTDSLYFASFGFQDIGNYSVRFISSQGCVGPDVDFTLEGVPKPSVNLPEDTIFCSEEGIFQIEIRNDFFDVQWFRDGVNLKEDNGNSRVYVTFAAEYVVRAFDEFGCYGTDTIQIDEDCPPDIYIPNSFSPNADLLNDFFNPVLEKALNYEIRIFDRWGELMYAGTQYDQGWPGTTLDGKPARPGVYVWTLVYDGNGDGVGDLGETTNGFVTLVK
ncbi:MAG: gliding motility-associated-like protein, partial [Luteibaculaceae bacterium]